MYNSSMGTAIFKIIVDCSRKNLMKGSLAASRDVNEMMMNGESRAQHPGGKMMNTH